MKTASTTLKIAICVALSIAAMACGLTPTPPATPTATGPVPTATPTATELPPTATLAATSTPAPAPTAAPALPLPNPSGLPIRVPVLVLAYYPPDPNDQAALDSTETGWSGQRIANMQAATQAMVEAGQVLISEATRYHGYRDPGSPMFLEYFTLDQKEYFVPMPRGHHLGNGAYRPHYNQILRDVNICNYVDVYGVKEVWIYGYHSAFIVPDESRMSSRYGDVSNAQPKDEEISEEYRLPLCTNSYVLYNFTYQPGGAYAIGNTIHNRLHQIENVIFFAENLGYPIGHSNVAGSLFWDDFSVYVDRASLPGYRASCGNTHAPPNVVSGEYIYDSREYRENNCETWHPDDSQTIYVNANCEQWGCTEVGFYKWFMQNMPGYNNGIVYDGRQMRNWWEAMVDFNGFIDAGRSLYTSQTAVLPTEPPVTPTPSPTSPPTLPPSPSPLPELPVLVFAYPEDGHAFDYGGDYLFEVQPIEGAVGYLWGFFQNGALVWENLRDAGQLSGNQYSFPAGSEAHDRFVPGDVEVWVRASVSGQWTEAAIITVHLQ